MGSEGEGTSVGISLDTQANRQKARYGGATMVKRILWGTLGWPLFHLNLRTMFAWRGLVLRLFGARVGRHVHIYRNAAIAMPWNLEIGDWSAIGEHARIYNLGRITIGRHVTISQYAHICGGTHDHEDPAMTLVKAPVVISDQAWVCADAFIGPGVTVGQGAVVGARGVVTRSVHEWTIVAGNPAKPIGNRKLTDG